jgi:CheY-like chemotaxis protein
MPDHPTRRRRYLFVDDETDFLAAIREILGGLSCGRCEILTAENHSQALALIAQQAPDVVILDVNMPVMDGLQFLRLLRRTHPSQQVVMLSGRKDDLTRQACLENGAALYLEKWVSRDGFEAVLAALDTLADTAPQTGFRGLMRQVGLQEVLQMECLSRKSSLLEIFTSGSKGRVFIRDGDIIHAEFGTLEGEVALYGLLALQGGEFNLKSFTAPPRVTISGPYEFLLMEAARLRDESTPEPPAPSAPAALKPELHDSATLPVAIEEVLLCSGAGAVLYQKGSESLDHLVNLLNRVEQQALQLANLAPTGAFDRLEMTLPAGRAVVRLQSQLRLFVRTSTVMPDA